MNKEIELIRKEVHRPTASAFWSIVRNDGILLRARDPADWNVVMSSEFEVKVDRHDKAAPRYLVGALYVNDMLEVSDGFNAGYLALCMRDRREKDYRQTSVVCVGVEDINSFPTIPHNIKEFRTKSGWYQGKRLQLEETETLMGYISEAEKKGIAGSTKVTGEVLGYFANVDQYLSQFEEAIAEFKPIARKS
jgi:hypothetical protein